MTTKGRRDGGGSPSGNKGSDVERCVEARPAASLRLNSPETRPPALRLHTDELIVDNFAGGGGASLGIEWALGRSPDIAVNHDPEAIAMHAANHPATKHYCDSVWDVDPKRACGKRQVALAWFSPDCTFHSKARGGKPFRDRNPARRRRGLAWVVVRWAKAIKPRVIILENVEEFQKWGPLLADGTPCPARRGTTYRRWVAQLENAGYVVESRELRACDYGAPTSRKRLFVIARSDGQPIVWPEPTHGPGRPEPYRTAAECISWEIPCPSIFGRSKALAENTLKRIARGIMRYVVDNPRPFIVPITHTGDARVHGVDEPMRTITTAHRGESALVVPYLVGAGGPAYSGEPVRADQPLGTVMPTTHRALVVPHITKFHSGSTGSSVEDPMPTVTSNGESARRGGAIPLGLAAATLIETRNGEREGQAPRVRDIERPFGTVTAVGSQGAVVAGFLARHYGGHENDGAQLELPMKTVTTIDHHALVASSLVKLTGGFEDHQNTAQPVDVPLHTIRAGGTHFGEVRAFLVSYYGQGIGQQLSIPMRTGTTKDRFGLVMVAGVEYAIADIGMRMLAARELYRAQGFPDTYEVAPVFKGKPLSKTAQVRMCGNSVPPWMSFALARAQFARDAEAVA